MHCIEQLITFGVIFKHLRLIRR